MALQIIDITRKFVMKNDDQETPLPDLPGMTPEEALNFYSATYPVLTSATIAGPEVIGSEAVYTFQCQLGTKG